jgi:hypothetical protein
MSYFRVFGCLGIVSEEMFEVSAILRSFFEGRLLDLGGVSEVCEVRSLIGVPSRAKHT